MKKQLEAKLITETDLPKLCLKRLYSLALSYNPLSQSEVRIDYKTLKANPKDSSLKSEFISKYLTFKT